MKQDKITFRSNGFTLSGIVHVPDDMKPGEKRPALMVLHGFGNNKDSANSMNPAELFCRWGYVTFRFDFRGCGASEGPPGRTICLEQVEDVKNAVTWLSTQPGIDPKRIEMEFLQPIERTADQEVADFIAAVVVDERPPIPVFTQPRIFMLVEGGAIEPGKAMSVLGEVRGDPVDDDADAGLVQGVDQVPEIVG